MFTRRSFLRAALAASASLAALPLVPARARAFCVEEGSDGPPEFCSTGLPTARPSGDPGFQPFWVATHLETKLWPTPSEINTPVEQIELGRLFRVDAPQNGYRLLVWDPRENRHAYVGSEAVGPVEAPFWSAFADDGRWIDVNLSLPQHLKAMQGDVVVLRDLITAGLDRKTRPGFYRIMRRVENETMDSRTVPDATRQYLLKDVLYTQYFHGDGSAIHYNWWASSWGYPGSQGCLGMRMNGAKFMWEWAGVGTPLAIHY